MHRHAAKYEGGIMKLALFLIMMLVGGCATFSSEHFSAEGAKASALCIKGGYAMAGGVVVGAKINDDFKGQVAIGPDCSVVIVGE